MVRLLLAMVLAQPPAAPPAAAPPAAGNPLVPAKPPEWPREIGGRPIDKWAADLSDADPAVREQAAKTLPYFGPQAARAFNKPLVALINDPDPGIRVNAIIALADIGFDSRDDMQRTAQALRQSIRDTAPGSRVRLFATRCLGAIGPEAVAAVEALAQQVARDPAWETRDAAAQALGRVGAPVYERGPDAQFVVKRPANAQARTRLTDMLKDPCKAVRLEAASALIHLGAIPFTNPDQYVRDTQPYVTAVQARLAPGTDKNPGERDPSVRLWLNTLLLMYDDRQEAAALREMTAAVTSTDPALRLQGLTAMTVLGSKAAPSLLEVRAALHASEPAVAKAAVVCLIGLGPEARKAVGDLQQVAAATTDAELKQMATEAARRLQPGAVKK
jgi:HEAT repeat protein